MGADAFDRKHMPMEGLDFFSKLERTVDEIWDEVVTWDWFAKRVVGLQLMTSADSIGANLVEGDGRYGVADSVRFFHIARASLQEAIRWIKRAYRRKLIDSNRRNEWIDRLEQTSRVICKLISYRKDFSLSNRVREERLQYGEIEEESVLGPQTSDLGPATCDLRPEIDDRGIGIMEEME